MTTYGPWLTPPPQTLNATWNPGGDVGFGIETLRVLSSPAFPAAFATQCEASGAVTAGTGDVSLDTLHVEQGKLTFDFDVVIASLTDYSGYILPAGASGVDYDPADPPAASWMTQVDMTAALSVSPSGSTVATTLEARTDPSWNVSTDIFVAGADLSSYLLAGSVTTPISGGSAAISLTASFPASHVVATAGSYHALIRLDYSNQRTHAIGSSDSINIVLPSIANSTAVITYQPRRYRFVYTVLPRLRQFPRDDGLGGAPRQGRANGSTSVQGSARQGWRGTYR